MIVADTSLIATLLLPRAENSVAEALLERDPHWTAPALWRYEFRNVLTTQVRIFGLPLDAAVSLFGKAEELIIEPDLQLEPEAILRLAQAKNLTAYDAEFVGVAYALKMTLVTLDRAILKAAPDVAVSPLAFIAA